MALVLGTRHTVVPVPDGEAAIRLLCGPYRPDLLTTDLQLPGIDGIAVVRLARTLLPRLPILLCSRSGSRPAGEGDLCDTYLAKPLDIGGLFAGVPAPAPTGRDAGSRGRWRLRASGGRRSAPPARPG